MWISIQNILKRRNVAKKNNKRSGNEKSDVDFEEEFELINSIDDSIKPDICYSIGQYTVKKKTKKVDTLSEEEVEKKVKKKNRNLQTFWQYYEIFRTKKKSRKSIYIKKNRSSPRIVFYV